MRTHNKRIHHQLKKKKKIYVYILRTARQCWSTSLQPCAYLAWLVHSPKLPPGGGSGPSGSLCLLAALLTSSGRQGHLSALPSLWDQALLSFAQQILNLVPSEVTTAAHGAQHSRCLEVSN